ncbi:MAG TPA: hypothetical protein PLJ78_16135 [Anaerolineae bacterium]|nr:hypothetical protein [Anaerolineae bacterium]HQK15462.1 hypothetical protein [Anaerolineae bacterium]
MANGEWQISLALRLDIQDFIGISFDLKMANGEWQMANGKWQMANGKYR